MGSNAPSMIVSTGSIGTQCTYDIDIAPIRTSSPSLVAASGAVVDGSTITSTMSGCTLISVDNILNGNSAPYAACGLQILSNT